MNEYGRNCGLGWCNLAIIQHIIITLSIWNGSWFDEGIF